MKQVRFEFEELPYETLSQFGLTQEMIEDLPMRILEELSHGRHSPVLPIKVNDDNGNTVTDHSRFAFVRKENGEADVVFYPVLKKSSLEKYSEEQQKQLRSGKVILADTVTADGRKTKAFVQIDTETNQVMSVPTQVIARNPSGDGRRTETQQCRNQGDAAGRTADLCDARRACNSRHQPAREGRHPLLSGRRQEMERADQKRMGQIHLRLLRLLDDGR